MVDCTSTFINVVLFMVSLTYLYLSAIGCLISLVTHPVKLIRRSAIKLLKTLSNSDAEYKLHKLASALVSQMREITGDHLHVNEVCSKDLN